MPSAARRCPALPCTVLHCALSALSHVLRMASNSFWPSGVTPTPSEFFSCTEEQQHRDKQKQSSRQLAEWSRSRASALLSLSVHALHAAAASDLHALLLCSRNFCVDGRHAEREESGTRRRRRGDKLDAATRGQAGTRISSSMPKRRNSEHQELSCVAWTAVRCERAAGPAICPRGRALTSRA